MSIRASLCGAEALRETKSLPRPRPKKSLATRGWELATLFFLPLIIKRERGTKSPADEPPVISVLSDCRAQPLTKEASVSQQALGSAPTFRWPQAWPIRQQRRQRTASVRGRLTVSPQGAGERRAWGAMAGEGETRRVGKGSVVCQAERSSHGRGIPSPPPPPPREPQ
jgi:hypothetical protein